MPRWGHQDGLLRQAVGIEDHVQPEPRPWLVAVPCIDADRIDGVRTCYEVRRDARG